MLRRLLIAGLAIAPASIALHWLASIGSTPEFVLSAMALIPLAWLIGEATEHAADHTGPGIGGFLNATFGNAPELIIALIAIDDGLPEVVRGSLTGSRRRQPPARSRLLAPRRSRRRDRRAIDASSRSALIAVALDAVPDPRRLRLARRPEPALARRRIASRRDRAAASLYVVVTWYSLRRHARAARQASDDAIDGWSLRLALVVLAVATVVTALVAEILVGSLEDFADKAGLTDFFVAAVIVAIVGNAAEHGGAVIVAKPRKDQARRRDRARPPPLRSPSS